MIIRAPAFKIDDRFEPIRDLCEILGDIWAAPAGSEWELNLSNCGYLGPCAAALIHSTSLSGRQLGQRCRVVLPSEPPSLRGFCTYSGLSYHLADGPRPHQDHPDCETVPLHQFYEVAGNHATAVLGLVSRHFDQLSSDNRDYLSTAIQEVSQNVQDHANSPIGGVYCARYLSNLKQVRFAMVDRGVTIAVSLARQGPVEPDEQALVKVFKGHHSSNSTPRNLGLGISNLAGIVKNLRGDLFVISGRGAATLNHRDSTPFFQTLRVRYPGTLVFFQLNVDDD